MSTRKKKELVGDYKNGGREWHPKGKPDLVNVHDFKDMEAGKAIPYGVYDIGLDEGYVTVGIYRDTAQFAVGAIRAWWEHLGSRALPERHRLTITADCGGSNGNRTAAVEDRAAELADETGLEIECLPLPARHLEVEQDRAPPLQLHLDELARQAARLPSRHRPDRRDHDQHRAEVYARLDESTYPDKIKVTDADWTTVNSTGTSSTPSGTTSSTPCPLNRRFSDSDTLKAYFSTRP